LDHWFNRVIQTFGSVIQMFGSLIQMFGSLIQQIDPSVWISDPNVWISDPNVWIIDPTDWSKCLDHWSKCLDHWSKCLDQLLFIWHVCVLSGWSSKTLILRGHVLQQALWQALYRGWGGWVVFSFGRGRVLSFFSLCCDCLVWGGVTSVVFFFVCDNENTSFRVLCTYTYVRIHGLRYIHIYILKHRNVYIIGRIGGRSESLDQK